jgi:hypothetical protein
MTTYNTIINKILKIENNIYFVHYKQDVDPFLRVILGFNFNIINNENIPNYKKKFKFLKNILNSFAIKGNREEEIMLYFNKIQRTYNALNRLVFNYKYKKAPIIVNTDMLLNEIQENDKNIVCIYQENARYLFKMYDLLKIINMSLIHSQMFFADPLCIKNPYNNLPFGKHILYYIHYYLSEKVTFSPKTIYTDLFLKFHSCQFNLTNFLNNYEYLLRENTITNHVKNTINDDLYKDIMSMINNFNNNKNDKKKILIHEKFPKDKIVIIFKPYLNMYLNSKYLLVLNLKYKAAHDLEAKLIQFQNFNPLFGRIKYIHKKANLKHKIETNDSHLNFNEYNNDEFLKDHLTYKYTNYFHANNNIFISNHNNNFDGFHFSDNDNDDNDNDDNDNDDNYDNDNDNQFSDEYEEYENDIYDNIDNDEVN